MDTARCSSNYIDLIHPLVLNNLSVHKSYSALHKNPALLHLQIAHKYATEILLNLRGMQGLVSSVEESF